MSDDTLLLIGCGGQDGQNLLETHARRLRRRGVSDRIRTMAYESSPELELSDRLSTVSGDRVFAMVVESARSPTTIRSIPTALGHVPGQVHWCRPPGWSPVLTTVLADVVREWGCDHTCDSVLVVGRGCGSTPYRRRVTQYHAERLAQSLGRKSVQPCFLLEDPAVEAVGERQRSKTAVAVALELIETAQFRSSVRSKLAESDAGVELLAPIDTHPGVTTAIHAEFCTQQILSSGPRTTVASSTAAVCESATDPADRADSVVTDHRLAGERRRPSTE